jgi:hypothetical protein
VSNAISSVASLLWPLVVLAALFAFRKPLVRLINQGDFTIKIAGQEITVGDLTRQQTDMISDVQRQLTALQARVATLEKPAQPVIVQPESAMPPLPPAPRPQPGPEYVGGLPWGPTGSDPTEPTSTERRAGAGKAATISPPGLPAPPGSAPWERIPQQAVQQQPAIGVDNRPVATADAAGPAKPDSTGPARPAPANAKADWLPGQSYQPAGNRPRATGVLWVDDHLKRHVVELDRLQRNGVLVDTASSTDVALDKLSNRRYQLIVSDMRRMENGQRVPDAGLRLTQAVRALDRETPIVIFSSGPDGQAGFEPILEAGATLVTTSPTALFAQLHSLNLI